MSCRGTNMVRRPKRRLWHVIFVALVSALFVAPLCTSQVMQKGIGVALARTSNATLMANADEVVSLIVP
jgi:hypothetical protein